MSAGVIAASYVDESSSGLASPGGIDWPFRLSASSITGVADEGEVTLWEDLGSGNTDAVAAGANPTYELNGIGGKPSVAFAGHRLVSARQSDAFTRTMIVVAQFDASGFLTVVGNASPGGTPQNGGRQIRSDGTKFQVLNSNHMGYGTSTSDMTIGVPCIWTVTTVDDNPGNPGTHAFKLNGAAAGGASSTVWGFWSPRTTVIGQGSGDTGWKESMVGLISEVLEADVLLTAPQLAAVHADLGAYYGITV